MELAYGMVIGLCFFICTVKAYSVGISHGKQLGNGNIPKMDLNPVKAVTNAVKAHQTEKEAEKVADEMSEVLGYDYDTALKAVKGGR